MAGHSHFKNIKRRKEALDQKKAFTFAKISRHITASVKEKGKDFQSNPSLRVAIQKAKDADMPKEKIERAIEKGCGEGEKTMPFTFEAYGPQGVAIIIEGSTDNKQRSLMEIKELLKKIDGKIADPGSVKWLFQKKGVIKVLKKEDLSLEGDTEEDEEFVFLYTDPEKIKETKTLVKNKGAEIFGSYIGWKPLSFIETKEGVYENIMETLEENESIENIYLNIKK